MKRLALLLAIATAILPGCRKRSDDDAPLLSLPFLLPTGPGSLTLRARGGTGLSGAGGAGGFIEVNNISGSDAHILTWGSIETSFARPSTDISFGSNVRTIATDTTLTVGSGLTAGSAAILGDDNLTTATGLRVLPGVTLTLGPSFDTDNADADATASTGTKEQVELGFNDGVLIEGTIVTLPKDGSTNSTDLYMNAANIITTAASLIDTRGASQPPGTDGSNGGLVWLDGAGSLVCDGQIRTRGGDGDDGGNGGRVVIRSFLWATWHGGVVDSSGGTGNDGTGGDATSIQLQGAANGGSFTGGGVFNNGSLTARGADGTLGGGNGAFISTYTGNSEGSHVNTGAWDSSGGSATLNGSGGNAGAQFFDALGGTCRSTGSFTARGGNGAGVGSGGNGAEIEVGSYATTNQPTPIGTFVSASMDCSGGDGFAGGSAGFIQIFNNGNWAGAITFWDQSPTVVAGYAGFDSSGGDGATNGGSAGYVSVNQQPSVDSGGLPHYGSLFHDVPATARGGAGANGAGGNGNSIFIGETGSSTQTAAPRYDRVVVNTAPADSRGGTGTTTGGNGGAITIFGRFNASNTGPLNSAGGNGDIGAGGNGGVLRIRSDGPTANEAPLTSDGGSSTLDIGGGGGQIFVEGQSASHRGAISGRGGAGITNSGGGGAFIEFGSWGAGLSSVSGSIAVPGGAGNPGGSVGSVVVDGIGYPLTNGSISF